MRRSGSVSRDATADILARAARHGDEHVLKFTDTAVEVYQRTGDPAAIHALGAAQLIGQP